MWNSLNHWPEFFKTKQKGVRGTALLKETKQTFIIISKGKAYLHRILGPF